MFIPYVSLLFQARQELLCNELKAASVEEFPDILRSVAEKDSTSVAKYNYSSMALHECIAKAGAGLLTSSEGEGEGKEEGGSDFTAVLLQGVEVSGYCSVRCAHICAGIRHILLLIIVIMILVYTWCLHCCCQVPADMWGAINDHVTAPAQKSHQLATRHASKAYLQSISNILDREFYDNNN